VFSIGSIISALTAINCANQVVASGRRTREYLAHANSITPGAQTIDATLDEPSHSSVTTQQVSASSVGSMFQDCSSSYHTSPDSET
jgi:hypothetical protein